ncbi:MAG TPA: glycosyltransferase family 2 protein [Polyangia bacterium]
MSTLPHIYAVPAYGRSPHLEACLRSLAAQTHPCPVVVSTSTPYDGLEALVQKHGAQLRVHGPNQGIGTDWNAALAHGEGGLVTVAHQDDLYDPGHCRAVVDAFAKFPDALIAFCGYRELLGDSARPKNLLLWIKDIQIEMAFLGRRSIRSRGAKSRLLRFGNPIAAPGVTLNLARRPGFRFATGMRTNMDWDAWVRLAREPGAFVRVPGTLMSHRIHGGSETTSCIADGYRRREDYDMFRAMWPAPVATVLSKLYAYGYGSNKEGEST